MKKILCLILCAALLVPMLSSCKKANDPVYREMQLKGDLNVVTFNCAAPWGSAIKGTQSKKRVKLFAAYMNSIMPDLIGTQEMNSEWVDALEELMPKYDCYGVERGGDDNEKRSEMNSIFWRRDFYSCIESDTFWLSETPDSESRYPDAGCNRICSYVILSEHGTGNTVIHMNTHLDNASEEAREEGMKLILQRLDELLESYPEAKVVLTGDLNGFANEAPAVLAAEKLTNCDVAAEYTPGTTYQGWGKEDYGSPIDFIFTNSNPIGYQILDDRSLGYISDHYGILAQIKY